MSTPSVARPPTKKPIPTDLEIQQKRLARKLKKEQKASTPTTPDINEHGFNTRSIARTTQRIHDGSGFTLLSYNILAQCLIRRKLFPDAGESIKWKNRSCVLLRELSSLSPDFLCLQEVGVDMLDPRISDYFKESGYQYVYAAGEGKKHGLIIAWRNATMEVKEVVDYNLADNVVKTNNIGLICVFGHNGRKLTIATTHLFWHPRGTCERARQAAMLIKRVEEVDAKYGQGNVIIAGDFNTEPSDPTYLAMTQRPFELDDRGREIMEESAMHKSAWIQTEEDADENEVSSVEQSEKVDWTTSLDALAYGPRMTSIYGSNYKNDEGLIGEPPCTNYAHVYRGCLDYVLIPSAKERFECVSLLKMPDLSQLSHGQPEEGKCCSDHFSLLVELRYKQ